MRYQLQFTSQFKRAQKKLDKKSRQLVDSVVLQLANGESLPPKNFDHALKGKWRGHRECHVKPDLLLIYKIEKDILRLTCVHVGSHSLVLE